MEEAGIMDLEAARHELDELCTKVHIELLRELPQFEFSVQPPAGTTLWVSPYAWVLLWPCTSGDQAHLEQEASLGQAWFDDVLSHAERRASGRPIDGYLVVALPEAPSADASEFVRRIELSTEVCRKHLIWPGASEDAPPGSSQWLRIADVTVLGFPGEAVAPSHEMQWPELDDEAEGLWRELNSIGVPETIIRHGGEA
jgi:hypothetical protein